MGRELWIRGWSGVHLRCSGCGLSGGVGSSPWVLRIGVVASLVWGLLRWAALAEGVAASASFGVIRLGLVCGLVSGVVLVSFCLGDIHGGISKYLMFGLLLWGFLGGGRISEFCRCGRVLCYWWAPRLGWSSCTGGCGGGSAFGRGCLLWGISDWGSQGFWLVASVGVVLTFWGFFVAGAFWGCVLLPPSGLCFFCLVVNSWGLCWVIRKQTIPYFNDL